MFDLPPRQRQLAAAISRLRVEVQVYRRSCERNDEVTIHKVIGRHAHATSLVYEHLSSTCEPVLWIADAAAWCVNAGGQWRRRIDPVLAAVIDVDCP